MLNRALRSILFTTTDPPGFDGGAHVISYGVEMNKDGKS